MNEAEAFTALLDWLSSSEEQAVPNTLATFLAERLADALLSEQTRLSPRARREAALTFLTKVTERVRELVDSVESQTHTLLRAWPHGDVQ